MLAEGHWVRFTVAGERYALPVEAVAQVISLDRLRPTPIAGWAGTVGLPEGTIPLADGAELLGESGGAGPPGPGPVIRGPLPLAFTGGGVPGLTAGGPCSLPRRRGP